MGWSASIQVAKIALPGQQLNEVDQREQLCSISNAANLCGLGDVNDSLQCLSAAICSS